MLTSTALLPVTQKCFFVTIDRCKEEATITKQTPLRKHLFSLELSSSVAVIAA